MKNEKLAILEIGAEIAAMVDPRAFLDRLLARSSEVLKIFLGIPLSVESTLGGRGAILHVEEISPADVRWLLVVNLGAGRWAAKVRGRGFRGPGASTVAFTALAIDLLSRFVLKSKSYAPAILFHVWDDDILDAANHLHEIFPRVGLIVCLSCTGLKLCTVQKGFGRVIAGRGIKTILDWTSISKELEKRFEPRHDIYDLSPGSPFARHFLPGAPMIMDLHACEAGGLVVDYTFTPNSMLLGTDILEWLRDHGCQDACIVYEEGTIRGRQGHVITLVEEKCKEFFGKPPLIEWHLMPSLVHAFARSPGKTPEFFFIGPGDPFDVGTAGEKIPLDGLERCGHLLGGVMDWLVEQQDR